MRERLKNLYSKFGSQIFSPIYMKFQSNIAKIPNGMGNTVSLLSISSFDALY